MQRDIKHLAGPSFWKCHDAPPSQGKELADENFKLLKKNPEHPSPHLKKVNRYRSIKVGKKYRALAVEVEEALVWFWIGTHSEYDKLTK